MVAPRSSSLRGAAAFVLALAGACRPPSGDLATGEHALSAAQKVSELSTDLSNESSGPAGFQEVNGQMMFFSTAGPLSTGMGLYRSDGTTAGTELVRDLDPRVANFWDVPHIVVLNDRGYWSQAGALWVTDGTAAGTQQVAAFGNAPGLGPTEPVVHGGAIFFGAGGSLYRSDGTPAGTQILAASVSPSGRWQEMGGKLYFGCQITSAAGFELCATDGTAAGTVMVKEILPGIQSSDPLFLGALGSKLLFSAVTDPQFFTRGLWSTDGTAAGTQQLVPPPGFSAIDAIDPLERPAAILGAQAYLPCFTFLTGTELCKTDGTPAGTSVLDVVPSPGRVARGSVVTLGSQLIFLASTTAAGVELWTSDGTVAGTKMLVDLLPGPSSGFAGGALFPMGGAVYFSGRATAGDPAELWKTDGTAAGTVRVARLLQPGKPEGAPLFLLDTGVLGTQLFFEADDGVTSNEPWVTDGTGAGTHLLKDLAPTRSRANVHETHAYHGDHYLSVGSTSGERLWKTDGTTAGTASFQTGQFFALTPVDHWLYYGELNRALWKTDGTTSGTIRVTDLAGDAALFHAFGRLLVYSAGTPDDTHGGLWFSDGTAAGTHLTTPAVLSVDALGIANGRVWSEGFAGSLGNELWTSDGTDAGTRFVKDIRAGSASSTPLWFVELNGQTLFTANDGVSGRELWKTDGTAAGTVRTADINPGSGSSNPANLTAWNGTVLFTADAGAGRGLWKTDGTTAGTVLLKAVTPADSVGLLPWGNFVFFAATDTAGTELWRSDGTPAGTVMVGDIYAGPLSSNPSLLVLAGSAGPLVFAAEEPLAGREIWQLAQPLGTPELLADIAPGVPSSLPTSIGVEGSSLIVTADDGTGYALWRIDGVGADGTPPVLTCPADVTVMTMNSQGTAVTFSPPTAMDDSGVAPTVTADRASGDIFPVGTTRVNVAATDGSNNTSRCSFVVDVVLQNTMPDAGPVDAPPDAGPVDPPPDAGPVDAPPDAGPIQPPPDAGPADAGPDGGNAEVPGEGARGGCGCSAEGATSWPTNALVLALVAVVLLRRPRRV